MMLSKNSPTYIGERKDSITCNNIYDLIDKLCRHCIVSAERRKVVFRNVTHYLSDSPLSIDVVLPYDETFLVTNITNYLNKDEKGTKTRNNTTVPAHFGQQSSSALFVNLHEQLKSSQFDATHRRSLLTFLFFMADSRFQHENGYNAITNERQMTSTPLTSNATINAIRSQFCSGSGYMGLSHAGLSSLYQRAQTQTVNTKGSTRLGSGVGSPSTEVHSQLCSGSGYMGLAHAGISSLYQRTQTVNTKGTSRTSSGIGSPTADVNVTSGGTVAAIGGAIVAKTNTVSVRTDAVKCTDVKININDDIIQDVIYAFTGIQGKYLKKDLITGKFKIDPKARSLNIVQAGMLLRLSDLGYYHDRVQLYTDSKSGLCALGLMGQGFISALKNELTKYYGMVAMLQEQLNKQRLSEQNGTFCLPVERLTLMKVLVWSVDPLYRLQWLATIAEACQEKKGGALASTVHSFLSNGNPMVQSLAKGLLFAICKPLYQMLTRWLLEGEICDPHSEFFIEHLSEVAPSHLWHGKFRVRTSMLPNFISTDLAHKVLVTGKSINFLCEVCEDKQPVKGRDELRACIDHNAEHIFSSVGDTKLHSTIDSIYLNTSKRVLDIVMGPHKLLDHLQAMRRYLLLGQGDFIGILMDNLKSELNKPAKELYCYDLSSRLDAAIRSTNAQYEDPEILNHLDVRLLTSCDGDIGWDIVSLQYTLRGPLTAMLEPSMAVYQVLFKPLWRMKHMEFVLSSKIWKDQICNAKLLRPMTSELNRILYRLHLFTSEMVHFIHQVQYYILFEVIECSWAELLERVKQAKTLDEILNTHDDFLNAIKCGAFLDTNSGDLCHNMESVYNGIVLLEIWQDKFYKICFRELEARQQYNESIAASEKLGEFGVTTEKQQLRKQEQEIFEQKLNCYHKTLENIGADYEKAVRCFLLALNSNNDHNLQLFGIRLDFNEYYKKRDQRLGVPLTFEHMRMSNVYYNGSKSLLGGSRLLGSN